VDSIDSVDAPKMVVFANGNLVEELSAVSSPPTILSPVTRVRRSGSFGSSFTQQRYRHHQTLTGVVSDAFSDIGTGQRERPISPRSASGLMGVGPCGPPISHLPSGGTPSIMNNEQYPCDCCRIEDQQYLRDFTPSGTMIRSGRSEVGFFSFN